jgi:23S rRNA (cytidine1920-2'-O)/16S rRNA (cytidine1409-2'-O)-methyltransferase
MPDDRFVLPPPTLPSLEGGTGGGGDAKRSFVSRAGHKLEAALIAFNLDVTGRTCADLGANVGGFTDCLLRYGAAKVYAVDTAYGVLAWNLRKDPRVVVRDRTNALHVHLPERVSLAAVDVGWTRQAKVLPSVDRILAHAGDGAAGPEGGDVLTLIKPHYESELARVQRGVLTGEQSEEVLRTVLDAIEGAGREGSGPRWRVRGIVKSPLEGQKGNVEYVAWLQRSPGAAAAPGPA